MTPGPPHEHRVLILAPTGKDATLTTRLLTEAGVESLPVPTLAALVEEIAVGVGVVLLAEEALAFGDSGSLIIALAQQPPWSDLPMLVLTRQGADSPAVVEALHTLGNVALLERPTRQQALLSAVRAALRARQKQYQIRDHLIEREQVAARLRETDRRKDEFLATLAHELRNPMAPIANSIQVLRLAGGQDPAVARMCEMLDRQVNHMVRLVDDLLDVSRITRGKVELRKAPVDLGDILGSAIETSQPLITARRHRLTIDTPPGPIPLHADLVRLSQVFGNLLNNAARYMEPGGQIRVTAEVDGAEVRVAVEDTGVGIPSEYQDGIFNMFTQVPRGPGEPQAGLGIGLTLVRSLVQMHGGRVDVTSPGPGLGSRFTVMLPLAEVEAPRPAPVVPDKSAPPYPGRILVVDDNHDAGTSLGLLLEAMGIDARVAQDGAEALRRFEAERPDVILLDIGMPSMDGHEVARRIRMLPGGEDVVLVALTGWGGEEDRRQSQAAGFQHHLTKPLEMPALKALLRSLQPAPSEVPG